MAQRTRSVIRHGLCGITMITVALAAMSCREKAEDGENAPPSLALQPDSAQLTFTIGDTVFITVYGTDPDGDALTFEYETRTENTLSTLNTAQWFPSATTATFSWTPDSADVTASSPVELIFIVKDGRGGYVDRKVTLNIVPGNGSPRFESSANELLRDCCAKPFDFEVRVRDDDSTSLDLKMTEGPQGADFSVLGRDGAISRGLLSWKPTAEQAKQRVHSATFVANDGENPAVTQRLTIIIPPNQDFGTDVSQGDAVASVCAGNSIIEYTRRVEGRQELGGTSRRGSALIEAKLTPQGAARYDDLFLVWEYRDPLLNMEDDEQPSMMEAAEAITRTDDPNTGVTRWIVSYELGINAVHQPFFYRVCAYDRDVNADVPDQIVCAPSGQPTYYSFRAYAEQGAVCEEEIAEKFTGGQNDTFEQAQFMQQGHWERRYVCQDNPDFFIIEVKPGAKLKPVIVSSPDQQLDIKIYDHNRMDVTRSLLKQASCGGFATAELELPSGAAESRNYYIQVNGADAAYHAQVISLTKANEDQCVDDAIEPNDTTRQASTLQLDTASPGRFAICPDGDDVDIYKFDLRAGQKLDLMMGFSSGAANIADMTIFSPGQRDEVSKTSIGSGFTFASGTTEEPLSYEARQCGTHYLLVFSADGEATGEYTLRGNVSQGSCQDTDEFAAKCNHTLGDAQLFAYNTTYRLELCDKGEDWLRRRSLKEEFLAEVSVEGGDTSGVTFTLHSADGAEVAAGTPDGQGNISLDYVFPDEAFYYFRIASERAIKYEFLAVQ